MSQRHSIRGLAGRYATSRTVGEYARRYKIALALGRWQRARYLLEAMKRLRPVYSFSEHLTPGIEHVIGQSF